MNGSTVQRSGVVAGGTNRWATIGVVAVVAATAGGFVGTQLHGSDPQRSERHAAAFGCGGTVTLVIDMAGLDDMDYELRAEIRGRMLPLTNDMTEPVVGAHRDHQYLRPDEGRILVAAAVPSDGSAIPYEVVAAAGGVIARGTEAVRPCTGR